MLFVQIVVVMILAAVLVVVYQTGQKSREVKQIQPPVVIGNLIVIHSRDACSRETEYRLAGTPKDMGAPTVVLKCSYDGDTDIRFGMTSGQAPIRNLGAHKLALLEQALPDIRGLLVNKNA